MFHRQKSSHGMRFSNNQRVRLVNGCLIKRYFPRNLPSCIMKYNNRWKAIVFNVYAYCYHSIEMKHKEKWLISSWFKIVVIKNTQYQYSWARLYKSRQWTIAYKRERHSVEKKNSIIFSPQVHGNKFNVLNNK